MRRADYSKSVRRRVIAALVTTLLVTGLALTACGGDEGGPPDLRFFIFNEPSGMLPKFAESARSSPTASTRSTSSTCRAEADQQREQLVRRLGAEDDSIDIIGMDVVWTGEFANAGWVEPWTGADAKAVTDGVFPSVIETATFEDKLWAAPIWTNTELLWYRKDLVPKPPETWDEMLKQAEEIGDERQIQVQGNRYEGLMVWVNSMVASAGTRIV